MYRFTGGTVEVLVAHPGGPFFKGRGAGWWSIPKGEIDADDVDGLAAARREFEEETGFAAAGAAISLGVVKQKSGKLVEAWGVEGDLDPGGLVSNTVRLQWPPRSGRYVEVPEIDEVVWATPGEAKRLLNTSQAEFVDRLVRLLGD